MALAADYGNLGDLAITRAQRDFLQSRFPNREVVEVPISQTTSRMKRLSSHVHEHDLVALIGGGNTGYMYDDMEFLRQVVVRAFPNTKIIAFPQSASFPDSAAGRRALRRAQRAYSRHSDLTFMARDLAAEKFMKENFSRNRVVLSPDVVLTLDRQHSADARQGVVLALRDDAEAGLTLAKRHEIQSAVPISDTVLLRDTHIGDSRLDTASASRALDLIWDDFGASRYVVTDRLHGMIFCVITGTPCVAIDSANGKVGDFHSTWLRSVPGVKFVTSADGAQIVEIGESLAGTRPDEDSLREIRNAFEAAFETALGSSFRG